MKIILIRRDQITLAHAVKAAGFADSGGQAKWLVRERQFTVNGEVEIRPGRKLFAGDRLGPVGGEEYEIRRETSEG